MPQQPPNPADRPIGEHLDRLKGLTEYLAMMIMVFIRRRLGYRLLNPAPFVIIVILVMMLSGGVNPDSRPGDLTAFTVLAASLGFYQRFVRWQEFRRGVKGHSYYLGDSIFYSPRLPRFLRANRRVQRFLDPLVCLLAGVFLIPHSALLGVWLIACALCLKALEDAVHRREFNQKLDMIDGLVTSEWQGEAVERFSETADAHAQPQGRAQGIPTGLGGDLAEQIKNRKSKRNRPKQNK